MKRPTRKTTRARTTGRIKVGDRVKHTSGAVGEVVELFPEQDKVKVNWGSGEPGVVHLGTVSKDG